MACRGRARHVDTIAVLIRIIYIGFTMPTTGEKFERVAGIMTRLRSPAGCPWDREQTFDSIKPYTLEEVYEVFEAIDERNFQELKSELGDLLLQVLFYSQMAREAEHFSLNDVLDRLAEKLVRRHPHVFADGKAETSGEVLRNWEAIKAAERTPPSSEKPVGANDIKDSALAGASSNAPALLEAYKISALASHAGFDWPEVGGIFEKLQEETQELQRHLEEFPAPGPRPTGRSAAGAVLPPPEPLRLKLQGELGDLFFVLVNLARYLSVDPESALKHTNRKFRRRFAFMEQQLHSQGRKLEDAPLEEMEALWQQAKQQEPSPA
jgi:MazG family protein